VAAVQSWLSPVQSTGLISRRTRKGIKGSNPLLSAKDLLSMRPATHCAGGFWGSRA
jgi:hypothetical protein